MRHAFLTLVSLAVFTALLSVPARAEAQQIIGILAVETEGLPKAVAASAEAALEEGLRSVDTRLSPRAELRKQLSQSDYIEGCRFGPCLRSVRAVTGIPTVLTARIQGAGSSYSFVMTLVDTQSGLFLSQVYDVCTVCTVQELVSSITLNTISLVTQSGGARVERIESSSSSMTTPVAPKAKAPSNTLNKVLLGVGVVATVAGATVWSTGREEFGVGATAGGVSLIGSSLLLWHRF